MEPPVSPEAPTIPTRIGLGDMTWLGKEESLDVGLRPGAGSVVHRYSLRVCCPKSYER